MTADAEKFAAEDAKKKELAEARNMGETLAYTTEKMVKDNESKIKDDDKKELNAKMEKVRKAVKGDNVDEIKKATEELSKSAQRIGGELYKQTNNSQPTTNNAEKTEEKSESEAKS